MNDLQICLNKDTKNVSLIEAKYDLQDNNNLTMFSSNLDKNVVLI